MGMDGFFHNKHNLMEGGGGEGGVGGCQEFVFF